MISVEPSVHPGKGCRWLLLDNVFSAGSLGGDVTRTTCMSLAGKIGACMETSKLIGFPTPLSQNV